MRSARMRPGSGRDSPGLTAVAVGEEVEHVVRGRRPFGVRQYAQLAVALVVLVVLVLIVLIIAGSSLIMDMSSRGRAASAWVVGKAACCSAACSAACSAGWVPCVTFDAVALPLPLPLPLL